MRETGSSPTRDFNPRSPCGERPGRCRTCGRPTGFQSTLSLRRATFAAFIKSWGIDISIHALLAESDLSQLSFIIVLMLFQSTLSLRRATTDPSELGVGESLFQSTLSLRRATTDAVTVSQMRAISIHALLAESDEPPDIRMEELP